MTKIYGLVTGIALATVAPLALADDTFALMPEVGGAEITQYVQADTSGINADTNSDEFWYAGTSGVPSN